MFTVNIQCVLVFQLIQDEIKALVQLQNRQASIQPHTELSPTPVTTTTTTSKDYNLPLLNSDCTIPKNAPALSPFSSPSPPLHRPETLHQGEELATTVLSSGYGTLSAWETGLVPGMSLGAAGEASQGKKKHQWSSNLQDGIDTTVIRCQQQFSNERISGVEPTHPALHQQQTSGCVLRALYVFIRQLPNITTASNNAVYMFSCSINQRLTSWAQRQKRRPKKSKAGQASSQISEYQQQPRYPRETTTQSPLECIDSLDQVLYMSLTAGAAHSFFRRDKILQ